MLHLVEATKKSLSDRNWYAALTLALSIPDICGQLQTPTRKSQVPYERWYSKYVLPAFQFKVGEDYYPFLTASDCYALRCAYLHQGEFGIEEQKAREVLSRVTFRAPHPDDFTHLVSNGKVLHLKVDMFCNAICGGVESWMEDTRGNSDVQERIQKMGRIAEW